ncbi:type II toxin-antitoxin system HicA family toxin [Candidatus Curtissbacteria bacterium]|nr:type II toxin-antitoxin system HicA family toxin [Candidatus Curtissbacteria bacterium]
MAKLPSFTPKKLIKKLKSLGFIEDHKTGSHLVMYNPKTKRRAVIAYHLKDIPKGTLSSLLKEAGISKEELS